MNSGYRKSAIDFAKKEAIIRNLQLGTHYKNLAALIKDIGFESVENTIKILFPEHSIYIEEYRKVYNALMQIEPSTDNSDYLNIENYNGTWKIEGEDLTSGEKCGLEFYKWCDWLSFLIKNEQLNIIGRVEYISACLLMVGLRIRELQNGTKD